MITIKLKKWVPINDLEHLATTWQIATDQEFTNIVEDVRSDTMLEFYYSDIVVPTGDTYYVRAMRHFENPADDYWSDIMPINNIQKEYSNMLLAYDIIIDKPTVYVDRNEIDSDSQTIALRTSKFRSKQDGHVYTHWIIKDEVGNTIYSNLYNASDKEEHAIDNLDIYKDKSKLFFMAIHVGGAGVESPVGVFEVVLHDFNFTLRPPTSIVPRTEATVRIDAIDSNFSRRIKQIKAFNKDYVELISLDVDYEIEEFKIPWNSIIEDSLIYVEVMAYDNNGKFNKYKTTLDVLSDSAFTEEIVLDYEYNKVLEDAVTYDTLLLPNGLQVFEQDNGDIYTAINGSDKVHILKQENGSLVDTGMTLPGVSLLTTSNENTFIKKLENNLLIIDTPDADGNPTFIVYQYSMDTGLYSLESTLVRSEETHSTGMNGAIVQISNTEFVYLPIGTSTLKTFDYINNTVTTLANVPYDVSVNSGLIRLSNGQLMVFGGTEFITKVFNLETEQFVDGVTLSPGNFVGNSVKTVRLMNNDVLVFRTLYQENDDSLTEPLMSYFDQKSNQFYNIDSAFVDDKYPKSTIVLKDGSVLLAKYTEERFVGVDLQPEELLVQKFV